MTRYCGPFLIRLLVAGALICAAPAMAQDVVKLGDFQDWAAFSSGSGADKVCYVASRPTRLQGGAPWAW